MSIRRTTAVLLSEIIAPNAIAAGIDPVQGQITTAPKTSVQTT